MGTCITWWYFFLEKFLALNSLLFNYILFSRKKRKSFKQLHRRIRSEILSFIGIKASSGSVLYAVKLESFQYHFRNSHHRQNTLLLTAGLFSPQTNSVVFFSFGSKKSYPQWMKFTVVRGKKPPSFVLLLAFSPIRETELPLYNFFPSSGEHCVVVEDAKHKNSDFPHPRRCCCFFFVGIN